MIGLIQRVARATVRVDGQTVGAIDRGVLALIGVTRGDAERNALRLAERLLAYRVFPDEDGRMNRSVVDIAGGILLVPQFTLAADTTQGNRAGFQSAAEPALATALFERLVTAIRGRYEQVATGIFGAHMEVSLVNDGPVTFWLEA